MKEKNMPKNDSMSKISEKTTYGMSISIFLKLHIVDDTV